MKVKAAVSVCIVLSVIPAIATAQLTIAARSKTPSPPANGLMTKVPMKLGYYVNDGQKCSQPSTVTKFDPNSVKEISDEGAFVTKLASVAPARGGYWLKFAGKWEEPDPTGIWLRPKGPGRVEVEIQDTAQMHFCRPEELPAAFRK